MTIDVHRHDAGKPEGFAAIREAFTPFVSWPSDLGGWQFVRMETLGEAWTRMDRKHGAAKLGSCRGWELLPRYRWRWL